MTEFKNKKINIAVIGGGASGMTAALFASQNTNCEITLFERNEFVGKKLLSTGNGRCNLSNVSLKNIIDLDDYGYYFRGSAMSMVKDSLIRFGYDDLISFFKSIGISCIERDGYVYPRSNQAASVRTAFEMALNNKDNIKVICNTKINKIEKNGNAYLIYYKKEKPLFFDKVIMCSGGNAYPKSGSDGTSFYLLDILGIPYNKMLPSLVECHTKLLQNANGVRSSASIYLEVDEKIVSEKYFGELQINKNGISGIVVFQVSGIAAKYISLGKSVYAIIDFLPDMKEVEIEALLNHNLKLCKPDDDIELIFNTIIPNQLIREVLDNANINSSLHVFDADDEIIYKIVKSLKYYKVKIDGVGDFDKAQCGTGGIDSNSLTPYFELKAYPNLFVCGEIVDVDGICGGYNLSWAFISGAIAGMEAAK